MCNRTSVQGTSTDQRMPPRCGLHLQVLGQKPLGDQRNKASAPGYHTFKAPGFPRTSPVLPGGFDPISKQTEWNRYTFEGKPSAAFAHELCPAKRFLSLHNALRPMHALVAMHSFQRKALSADSGYWRYLWQGERRLPYDSLCNKGAIICVALLAMWAHAKRPT